MSAGTQQSEEAQGPVGAAASVLRWIAPFASILALLIAWEVLARSGLVLKFLLPPLSEVLARIWTDLVSGKLLYDMALTLYRTLVGFGGAAIFGVTLGILIARNSAVRWFFDPIVSAGLPMPKIVLLPAFTIWFGFFDLAKILMVAFSASFQIIITTWAAARSVEKEMIWSARSLGASEGETLRQVILPAAAPQILTGLQVAMPICLIVVLITEMTMGGRGLGDTMLKSARYVDSVGVFAGIVEIGLLGFGIIRLMEIIRRRLLRWHPETQRVTTV